jgi:hypothetical protein
MSLLVQVYLINEKGKWVFEEQEDVYLELAGFENCRKKLYGSDLAVSLGLELLPWLASGDLHVSGEEVAELQAEAEIMIRESLAFEEHTDFSADYVERRAENIRQACLRAKKIKGNVVIW